MSRIQDRRSYHHVLEADIVRVGEPEAGSFDAPEAFDAFVHKYDLTGRELHSKGMDNGARWGLPDVSGAPALTWKGKDTAGEHWFMLRPQYDVLRRQVAMWETVDWNATTPPEPKCRALTIFGEEVSNPADSNYLGRMLAQYDSGGATFVDGYDLHGAPLLVNRTMAKFVANRSDSSSSILDSDPDYSAATAVQTSWSNLHTEAQSELEPTSSVSESTYDALGRVVEAIAAGFHPAARPVHTYNYGRSGALAAIDVKDRTGTTHNIITYIEHNARGQRTRVERGNGVASTFTYDPHTFRVTSIRAKGGGKILQELRYTYDAAGNVLRIEDAAQQDIYFANTVVEPVQTFEVDALYRLVEATGREHAPVFGLDPSVLPKGLEGVPSQLSSDEALRTYRRTYKYDAAGNLRVLDVEHGWRRRMLVADDSNRLVGVAHGRWPYGHGKWSPSPSAAPSWAPSDWSDQNPLGAPLAGYPYFEDGSPENWLALLSDQFGNMLHVPNVDVMKWDRAGNLRYSQSAAGSDQRVWYQYGADNQRVRKVVEVRTNSSSDWRVDRETLYLAGAEVFRSYDGSGALEYERETVHVMDGDRREALLECDVRVGGVVPDPVVVKIRYMLSDHLRSASVELDHEGKVISYETFHPYGTTAYFSVSDSGGYPAKRYRYSGKERDAETGLDYFGYRYLCTWLGRWVSADPAGTVDGLNLVDFVVAQVVSARDGDGRKRTSKNDFFSVDDVNGTPTGSSTTAREVRDARREAPVRWGDRAERHDVQFGTYRARHSSDMRDIDVRELENLPPSGFSVVESSRSVSIRVDDDDGEIVISQSVFFRPAANTSGTVPGMLRTEPSTADMRRFNEVANRAIHDLNNTPTEITLLHVDSGRSYEVRFEYSVAERESDAQHVFDVYAPATTGVREHDLRANARTLATNEPEATIEHELGHGVGLRDLYAREAYLGPVSPGLMGPKIDGEHAGGFGYYDSLAMADLVSSVYAEAFQPQNLVHRTDANDARVHVRRNAFTSNGLPASGTVVHGVSR